MHLPPRTTVIQDNSVKIFTTELINVLRLFDHFPAPPLVISNTGNSPVYCTVNVRVPSELTYVNTMITELTGQDSSGNSPGNNYLTDRPATVRLGRESGAMSVWSVSGEDTGTMSVWSVSGDHTGTMSVWSVSGEHTGTMSPPGTCRPASPVQWAGYTLSPPCSRRSRSCRRTLSTGVCPAQHRCRPAGRW